MLTVIWFKGSGPGTPGPAPSRPVSSSIHDTNEFQPSGSGNGDTGCGALAPPLDSYVTWDLLDLYLQHVFDLCDEFICFSSVKNNVCCLKAFFFRAVNKLQLPEKNA